MTGRIRLRETESNANSQTPRNQRFMLVAEQRLVTKRVGHGEGANLPGDANEDGLVNIEDLKAMRNNLGRAATEPPAAIAMDVVHRGAMSRLVSATIVAASHDAVFDQFTRAEPTLVEALYRAPVAIAGSADSDEFVRPKSG